MSYFDRSVFNPTWPNLKDMDEDLCNFYYFQWDGKVDGHDWSKEDKKYQVKLAWVYHNNSGLAWDSAEYISKTNDTFFIKNYWNDSGFYGSSKVYNNNYNLAVSSTNSYDTVTLVSTGLKVTPSSPITEDTSPKEPVKPYVPPPKIEYYTNSITNYMPFDYSKLDIDLKDTLEATFSYTPLTMIEAEGYNSKSLADLEVVATDYSLPNYDYMNISNSHVFSINTITADISPLELKLEFNLFKNISVDRVVTKNDLDQVLTDTTVTTITKTVYPYSIYLKSVSVVPDSTGKNGYNVVLLKKPTIENVVYSVDVEGTPTECNSGYVISMSQSLNNAYYPNMKLSFNFIDYIGTEFSFTTDDPLINIINVPEFIGFDSKYSKVINLNTYRSPILGYHNLNKPYGGAFIGSFIKAPLVNDGSFNYHYLKHLALVYGEDIDFSLDITPNFIYGYYFK